MATTSQTCRLSRRTSVSRIACFCITLIALAIQAFPDEPQPVSAKAYSDKIKPLLQARCYACHGALKQKGELRLDTAKSILKGGKTGPAMQAGNPSSSLLIERVSASRIEDRMPPEHEGEKLGTEEIELLRRWILSGAPAPTDEAGEMDPADHWAFRPLKLPSIPKLKDTTRIRNPIDAFLENQRQRHSLIAQKEASREVLVRRLHVDLTGLPPTESELLRDMRDTSPEWYENLVERLLADPRHGERWARHWMDVWRYSDWWGLGDQLRNSQKHIWHWRDWIVESLNADIPYDEMIRLMLAADELHPNDLGKLRATGFLARNYFLFNRNQWMDETVEHVSKGLLGLTMNCAKCHDHKYDPVSQADFYKLRAVFEPYHARLEMTPGVTDWERDGIPRVFDRMPDTPTYRFVRGDESRPDKSSPVPPGIPGFLDFGGFVIRKMELPAEAWQPERRSYVFDTYQSSAETRLVEAERELQRALSKTNALSSDADLFKAGAAIARAKVDWARAELLSVQARSTATRATWQFASATTAKSNSLPKAIIDEARFKAITAEREAAVAKSRHAVADLEFRLASAEKSKKDGLEKELKSSRELLEKALVSARSSPGTNDAFTPLPGAKWTATRFLSSGADDPAVDPPQFSTGRRTALASWMTDRRNPLTARVAVNQIWSRHMGAPLSGSTFDLGRKTAPPANPELIDWLASEFVESGWSMKELHRLIVNSAAYRMSSSAAGTESNQARDPDNVHWWRRQPVRMESQVVRDSILLHAGQLDSLMGGPPVPSQEQQNSTRRSLYFFHSNNDRNLFLTTFDEAKVKECYRRDQSIVPQQALALANSDLARNAAPLIARRLIAFISRSQTNPTDRIFVEWAFRVLAGYAPREPEIAVCLKAMTAWTQTVENNGSQSSSPVFAREQLVWALLNHNDFVTIR